MPSDSHVLQPPVTFKVSVHVSACKARPGRHFIQAHTYTFMCACMYYGMALPCSGVTLPQFRMQTIGFGSPSLHAAWHTRPTAPQHTYTHAYTSPPAPSSSPPLAPPSSPPQERERRQQCGTCTPHDSVLRYRPPHTHCKGHITAARAPEDVEHPVGRRREAHVGTRGGAGAGRRQRRPGVGRRAVAVQVVDE
jgi:hypothetical protein